MVKDIDKAISFYEKVGLTLKQRWDNHYAMLVTEGITIGLHPADSQSNNSGTISIGFMIDKILQLNRENTILLYQKIMGLSTQQEVQGE